MKHIPNLLTLSNLLVGFVGIINVLYGELIWGAYMIFAASLFDLLDGAVARALKITSNIGKQLDSLADMVSFGVLPAMIMYNLILRSNQMWIHHIYFANIPLVALIPFVITAAAAIRLAKFNTDEKQQKIFIGLPTPAAAIFVGALPLMFKFDIYVLGNLSIYLSHYLLNTWVIISISALLALIMNARIKLFSFKFKNFSFKDNVVRYFFLLVAVILFIFLFFAAIPLLVIIYILISLILKNKINEI